MGDLRRASLGIAQVPGSFLVGHFSYRGSRIQPGRHIVKGKTLTAILRCSMSQSRRSATRKYGVPYSRNLPYYTCKKSYRPHLRRCTCSTIARNPNETCSAPPPTHLLQDSGNNRAPWLQGLRTWEKARSSSTGLGYIESRR